MSLLLQCTRIQVLHKGCNVQGAVQTQNKENTSLLMHLQCTCKSSGDRQIQRWIHIGNRVNPVWKCGKYYPGYIMIYFILFYFVRRRGLIAKWSLRRSWYWTEFPIPQMGGSACVRDGNGQWWTIPDTIQNRNENKLPSLCHLGGTLHLLTSSVHQR